jgi:hypothetical protein
MKVLPIVLLSLASAFAMADDNNKNCSGLDNDRARQECREHKYGSVDCSKLDGDQARRECREYKHDHDNNANVDCSKLDNDAARRACRERKYD